MRRANPPMARILLLIKGLGRGGAEQILVGAVQYGDRSRFEYEVAYLLPWKDALVGELESMGIPVSCLNGGRGVIWIPRLRQLQRRRKIDLVHIHSPYPAIGARMALGSQLPIVYTEHNVWPRYRPATYWGNLLTYSRNDHVFAVSEQVHRSARYPWWLRSLRMPTVETLYHGPNPDALARTVRSEGVREEFGIPPDVPLIGSVANFKVHKGHEFLLRAAVLVRKVIPEVRFLLVGTGPMEETRRREAIELGLDGSVVFAGFRKDPLRLVSELDLFVLASLQEGLSIALVEAMALGKAVVVTNVGGIPEVIEDGREGFIVAPRDPRALASGILQLLQDDSLRAQMGAAARQRAHRFDIRSAVRRMETVYTELLAR